jgi:ribosomal protein S2
MNELTILLNELYSCKAHLGSRTAISSLGIRNKTALHDPQEILNTCRRTLELIQALKARRGSLFFVNTNPKAKELICQTATQMNQSFFHDTWVAGSLTNWKQISQSVNGFQKIQGSLNHIIQNHSIPAYEHARKKFEGLKKPETSPESFHSLKTQNLLPDFLILTCRSIQEQELLIQEAKTQKIPVLCFVDDMNSMNKSTNNSGPNMRSNSVEYILPGNTESPEFFHFYLNLMVICWTNQNSQ